MKFYRRWITDYHGATAALSMIEHGAYTLLLDHCYLNSEPLPADKQAIYRLCRAFEREERAAIDRVLGKHFTLEPDGYHNSRADAEIARNAEYSEAQRERSALGVAARTGSTPAPRTRKATQANGESGFAAFWSQYPRHEGKKKAEQAWDRLHPDAALRAVIMEAVELQKIKGCLAENFAADGRSTIPHGTTWLNGRRWEDEPPAAATPSQRNEPGSAPRPTIACETCGRRVFTWIGRQCDPCYRGEKRP